MDNYEMDASDELIEMAKDDPNGALAILIEGLQDEILYGAGDALECALDDPRKYVSDSLEGMGLVGVFDSDDFDEIVQEIDRIAKIAND